MPEGEGKKNHSSKKFKFFSPKTIFLQRTEDGIYRPVQPSFEFEYKIKR